MLAPKRLSVQNQPNSRIDRFQVLSFDLCCFGNCFSELQACFRCQTFLLDFAGFVGFADFVDFVGFAGFADSSDVDVAGYVAVPELVVEAGWLQS